MKTAWLVLVLMLTGELLASPFTKGGEDWPQYKGNPEHDNYRKVKDKIRVPKVLWRLDDTPCPVPAVVGEDVYSGGRMLRLVDLEKGEVKASWQPEGAADVANFRFGTPVVLDDLVIAHASNGWVHALDRKLEKVVWSSEVQGASFFSGVYGDGLFVISAGDRVVALEAQDGSERWSFKLSRLAGVEMTPAMSGGKVLFGSKDGAFHALSMDKGEEVWTFKGERAFGWTNPVVAYGKIFVGDRGGVINAFDLKKGTRVWEQESGVTGLSTPGIVPGNIIVGFGRVVIIFDEKTGKPDSKGRTFKTGANPFGSPTLVGDTLYFGNLDGHLYAFDYKTGQYKWAFEVGEKQQVHDFVYHGDILLVATTEGLYALGNDPKTKKLPSKFVLIADTEPRQGTTDSG